MKIHCKYDKVVGVKDLVPNPDNPNRHPDKQIELLSKLIKVHGWRSPITVSNQSGKIVRGHGRYLASLKLGLKNVPVDYQDYDSYEMELADLAADNRIAELSDMGEELTAALLSKVEEAKIDIELTGYSYDQFRKLIEKSMGEKEEKPEVEFTEELHESSNYIVLYFNNDIDWLQALTLFELKTVKALDSKEGYQKMGIGRVLNGSDAIEKLRRNFADD